MDYEIVATLGPSTDSEAAWQALREAGATAFRLNTSHLSLEQLDLWLERLERFGQSASGQPGLPPLVLDLQGSKWRLGLFASCELEPGQLVELVFASLIQHPAGVLPVPHLDFFEAAAVSSGEVLLNDAKVALAVESAGSGAMRARVVRGGPICSAKGITYRSSDYRHESLSRKDQAIVERTRQLQGVRYALSYVRDEREMAAYRARLEKDASDGALYFIAKLERQPAIDQAGAIAASADELWVCRGDLGAELGARAMAEAVYRLSCQLDELAVPVLMAGQVLEHMSEQPTPTRSELCYLHDALERGFGGVVLSDETAIGRHPIESCRTAALFRSG